MKHKQCSGDTDKLDDLGKLITIFMARTDDYREIANELDILPVIREIREKSHSALAQDIVDIHFHLITLKVSGMRHEYESWSAMKRFLVNMYNTELETSK